LFTPFDAVLYHAHALLRLVWLLPPYRSRLRSPVAVCGFTFGLLDPVTGSTHTTVTFGLGCALDARFAFAFARFTHFPPTRCVGFGWTAVRCTPGYVFARADLVVWLRTVGSTFTVVRFGWFGYVTVAVAAPAFGCAAVYISRFLLRYFTHAFSLRLTFAVTFGCTPLVISTVLDARYTFPPLRLIFTWFTFTTGLLPVAHLRSGSRTDYPRVSRLVVTYVASLVVPVDSILVCLLRVCALARCRLLRHFARTTPRFVPTFVAVCFWLFVDLRWLRVTTRLPFRGLLRFTGYVYVRLVAVTTHGYVYVLVVAVATALVGLRTLVVAVLHGCYAVAVLV